MEELKMNLSTSFKLLVIMFALLTGLSAAQEQPLIIETTPEGKNSDMYGELEGKWYDSVGKSTAEDCTPGIKTRYCDFRNEPAYAVFQPVLGGAGNYEIFVTWGESGNADKAKYIISHTGGKTIRYLVQDGWGGLGNSNADKWHSLGTFALPGGNRASVVVTDEECSTPPDPKNHPRLYCDAIKFVPTSKKPDTFPTMTPSRATPRPQRPTPVQRETPSRGPVATPVQPPDETSPFLLSQTPVPVTPTPASPTPSGLEINWYNNVLYAQQQAQQQGRKLLVFFYTETSPECTRYEQESFSDPEVNRIINNSFIPIKFDMKSRPSEAYQLGAFRAPTVILYTSDGTPYRRIVGYKDSATLKNLLSQR